jgi:hypothetical protein
MTTQLYSYKNNLPATLPNRIRLSSGITRTDPLSFTPEEIADAGYVLAEPAPNINPNTQNLTWNGTEWIVRDLTSVELNAILDNAFKQVRQKRDKLINDVVWQIQRYESETRQGIAPTDSIVALDTYVQALRDITKQSDPFNIEWPILTN